MEFNSGEYFREINVFIVDDEVLEDLEMFSATLTSYEPNVVVEEFSDRANVSIVDEDCEYSDFVSTLYGDSYSCIIYTLVGEYALPCVSLLGVIVRFNPTSYIVQEGSFTYLRINITGDSDVPVEVTLSTSGVTATGLIIYCAGANVYTVNMIIFRW